MTTVELKSGTKFGKECIEACKKNNTEVPVFVYERIIELQDQLIEFYELHIPEENETSTTIGLKAGIKFGKECIDAYKKNDEAVFVFAYERIIELQEQLVEYYEANNN